MSLFGSTARGPTCVLPDHDGAKIALDEGEHLCDGTEVAEVRVYVVTLLPWWRSESFRIFSGIIAPPLVLRIRLLVLCKRAGRPPA
jgi:hypothetical protein